MCYLESQVLVLHVVIHTDSDQVNYLGHFPLEAHHLHLDLLISVLFLYLIPFLPLLFLIITGFLNGENGKDGLFGEQVTLFLR